MTTNKFEAVFFDLDGTLLDTAPDLIAALNDILEQHQLPPTELLETRSYVHGGSITMIKHAFNIDQNHPTFKPIRAAFLNRYRKILTQQTTFFPGIETVLNHLDDKKLPWGIITNKPEWLTIPILEHFQLTNRIACLVAGDTLSTRKPDPAPLHYACHLTNCQPHQAIYIGDAESDVITAKAAGMPIIAVTYGYHHPSENPTEWPATHFANTPEEIIKLL